MPDMDLGWGWFNPWVGLGLIFLRKKLTQETRISECNCFTATDRDLR